MRLYISAILLLFVTSIAWPQAISHQNWQNQTVSSDTITVDCASLLLPFELGRLIVENNPTTERGEMDKSLRSAHAAKITLQPESGESDQITNISGCTTNGARVQLATVDSGDSITIVHTPGVIEFAGGSNVVLSDPRQILTLQRKSGIWVADSGLGGGGGSGGNLEDLFTGCAAGRGGVSNGSGGVDCGGGIFALSDCSSVSILGQICIDTDDGFIYAGDGTVAQRANPIRSSTDCTPFINVGDLCLDTDDPGNIFIGNGEDAILLGGGGGGGSSSLDEAFNIGKVIDGANSEGNAVVIGNGTDGFKIFVGTGGPTIKCFVGGNACDITIDIPSARFFRIKYDGTDGLAIDSSGNVTLANNMLIYRSYGFNAGTLSTDSTNCLNAEERQINGGAKVWTIKCSDNAASIIYGNAPMPDGYNGGNVTFEMQSVNENASPSGNLVFELYAMCRSAGDVLNNTWGSVATLDVTSAYTTQYLFVHSNSAQITPNGTCAAGDHLFWRMVMDATLTTTQVANTYVISVKMEYPTSDWSDQ